METGQKGCWCGIREFSWDEETQEIFESNGVAEIVIGYAKTKEEARAFIEF